MKLSNKTITLLSVGTIALGALSVLMMSLDNNSSLLTIADNLGPVRELTLTVNASNRYLDCKADDRNMTMGAVCSLSDNGAYGVIRTSQNISGIKDSDNAVLILWNMNSMYFEINSTWYDGKVITKNNNVIQTYKFDHLSQIDIKLNKGNGEDRILSLTSEINNSSKGIFNVIDESSSYIQYSWKPDDKGGFITSTDKVRFEGVNSSGNKAVWVTDLVFHYTCQSIIA